MTKRLHFSVLALSLFAVVLASCNSSSSPSGGGSAASGPNVGSTFTISSNNGGFTDVETFTVKAADMSHLSGSHVMKAIGVHDNSQVDSMYMAYEANGDVSLFSTSWAEGIWCTLPFATHSDISLSANGGGGVTIQSVAHYDGPGASFSVSGKSYSTESVTVTQTMVYQGSTISVITEHYQFIPSIGLIAKDVVDPSNGTTGSESTLTAYNPK